MGKKAKDCPTFCLLMSFFLQNLSACIYLKFSPDSGVGDPINILYGLDTVDLYWKAYETLITKRITSVDIYCDSTDMFGFKFGHPDGTKTVTPNVIEPIGTNSCYLYTI